MDKLVNEVMSQKLSSRERYRTFVHDYRKRSLDESGEAGDASAAEAAKATIVLLPGSRRGELERHWPVMLAAAVRKDDKAAFTPELAMAAGQAVLASLLQEHLGGGGMAVVATHRPIELPGAHSRYWRLPGESLQ